MVEKAKGVCCCGKNLCSSAGPLKLPQYINNPQFMEELTLKVPVHLKGRTAVKIPKSDIGL